MRQIVQPSVALWLLLSGCAPNPGTDATDQPPPPGDDDDDDTYAHSGTTDSGTVDTGPLPPASIVINEIMPGNKSTINGPEAQGLPDWVEIVNTGEQAFDLFRLQLRNRAQDGIWQGTKDDGWIEPGDHFLIWLGEGSGGGVWTGFQLDKDEDTLIVIVDDVLT
jgi:hypothetical protein